MKRHSFQYLFLNVESMGVTDPVFGKVMNVFSYLSHVTMLMKMKMMKMTVTTIPSLTIHAEQEGPLVHSEPFAGTELATQQSPETR